MKANMAPFALSRRVARESEVVSRRKSVRSEVLSTTVVLILIVRRQRDHDATASVTLRDGFGKLNPRVAEIVGGNPPEDIGRHHAQGGTTHDLVTERAGTIAQQSARRKMSRLSETFAWLASKEVCTAVAFMLMSPTQLRGNSREIVLPTILSNARLGRNPQTPEA